MSSAAEGKRLLAFLHERVPRSEGGLDAFAVRHGLRRQTPYEWAAGKSKPNLGTLKPWADALGVTRAEMVAALDGVTSPAPAPENEVLARLDRIEARLSETAVPELTREQIHQLAIVAAEISRRTDESVETATSGDAAARQRSRGGSEAGAP